MPTEITPIVTGTSEPVPGTSEPVVTAVAPDISKIKAERVHAQATAAEQAQAEAEAAKAAEITSKATEQAQADIKAKADSDYAAKLAEANAALAKHQAESAPKLSMAEKLEQAQKLIGEGKFFEAAELINPGLVESAVKQVTGLTQPEQDKLLKKGVDPELVTKLDAQATRLAELEKQIQDRDLADAAKVKAQSEQNIIGYVQGKADSDYKFLAKNPDWVKAALANAETEYASKVKELGKDLDQAAKDALILSELAKEEAKHAGLAKLYADSNAPGTGTSAAPKSPVTVNKTITVGSVTNTNPGFTGTRATPKPVTVKAKSLEELKAARRAAAS